MASERPRAVPLPRGRHKLSREEVVRSQRQRIEWATFSAVAELGFDDAGIGDIVGRAAGSRETFYSVVASKEAAFWSAYESFAAPLIATARSHADREDVAPETRMRDALGDYLRALQADPDAARCLLVEHPGRAGVLTAQRQRVRSAVAGVFVRTAPWASEFRRDTYSAVIDHHIVSYAGQGRAAELERLLEPVLELSAAILGIGDGAQPDARAASS